MEVSEKTSYSLFLDYDISMIIGTIVAIREYEV